MTIYTMTIKHANITHEVHHKECKYRPKNQFYEVQLGVFYSDKAALNSAKTLYLDAVGCPHCMQDESHITSA